MAIGGQVIVHGVLDGHRLYERVASCSWRAPPMWASGGDRAPGMAPFAEITFPAGGRGAALQ